MLNLVVCVFSKLPKSVFETSSSSSMVFVAHTEKSWPVVCNHNENHLEGAATTCLEVESPDLSDWKVTTCLDSCPDTSKAGRYCTLLQLIIMYRNPNPVSSDNSQRRGQSNTHRGAEGVCPHHSKSLDTERISPPGSNFSDL